MAISAEEKAAKRAQALAKLEATRKRLAGGGGTPGSATGSSANKATQSGSSNQYSDRIPPNPAGVNKSVGADKSKVASTNRNAQNKDNGLLSRPYIEYDLSTLKDSKGGFLQLEESTERWLQRLPQQNPPLPLEHPDAPSCFECGAKELDFRMFNVFRTRVCAPCRKKMPEKYSLLTKTECKADYLLTDPELRDEEILPHLERPNPHQDNYSNMMLYMRYQAEEFAFKKWGGEEGLDAEYERREKNKVERKQKKFEQKLRDMRNKTRAQALTKTNFERHQHEWGDPEPQEDGSAVRKCRCGMQITELVTG